MRPPVFPVNLWAEAVFHVLAHVRATAGLASSVYDASYVERARLAVGAASERPLAEDAATLGAVLPTFASLARVQGLAWLFGSPERAARCVGRDLAELTPSAVDAPAFLAGLAGFPPAEILRAAAELELPFVGAMPRSEMDLDGLRGALEEVSLAAPMLSRCAVGVARSLGVRGRVVGREIWVGDASIEHAAWQAAHEATVAEVVALGLARASHDEIEEEALVLLARRAEAARLAPQHQAWLAHLGDACVLRVATAAREPRGRTT